MTFSTANSIPTNWFLSPRRTSWFFWGCYGLWRDCGSCCSIVPTSRWDWEQFSFCLAFGAVPESLITQVPFLANVRHVSNTFSCVLIIYLLVLAAFGLQQGWERRTEKDWIVDWVIVALLSRCIVGVVLWHTQARQRSSIPLLPLGHAVVKSRFFYFYAFSLVCALLVIATTLSAVYGFTRQDALVSVAARLHAWTSSVAAWHVPL